MYWNFVAIDGVINNQLDNIKMDVGEIVWGPLEGCYVCGNEFRVPYNSATFFSNYTIGALARRVRPYRASQFVS
jgi:hypothetical protein